MNQLLTDHPLALSVLLDDEIYVFREKTDREEAAKDLPGQVEQPEEKKPEKQIGFQYLGDNNKFWLIIVKEENAQFINDGDKQFLLKILAAKQLGLEDIAIINLSKYEQLRFESLKAYFAMGRILTFGFNPLILDIQGVDANQAGVYKNVKVLGTWSLAQLQADNNKKAVYWKELKNF